MPEHIKQALDIYVAQVGIINTLWNIFELVALAMLGYVYKDRTLMSEWKIKVGLSVGFSVFAWGNNEAMSRSQNILVAATTYLNHSDSSDPTFNQVLQSHAAVSVCSISTAHLVFTLLVLAAMWLPNLVQWITKVNSHKKTKAV
jgi:hypothetical protein